MPPPHCCGRVAPEPRLGFRGRLKEPEWRWSIAERRGLADAAASRTPGERRACSCWEPQSNYVLLHSAALRVTCFCPGTSKLRLLLLSFQERAGKSLDTQPIIACLPSLSQQMKEPPPLYHVFLPPRDLVARGVGRSVGVPADDRVDGQPLGALVELLCKKGPRRDTGPTTMGQVQSIR